MSARLTISAILLFVIRSYTCVFAFSPEVEQEVRAQLAIKRFLRETKPSWTCEYTLERLRVEENFVVYRVVLPRDQKCSKTARTEFFEAFYDPRRDNVVKMVPVELDPPPIDAKRSNQSLEPTAGRCEVHV